MTTKVRKYDLYCKLLICGDTGVGKTTLLNRLLNNDINDNSVENNSEADGDGNNNNGNEPIPFKLQTLQMMTRN